MLNTILFIFVATVLFLIFAVSLSSKNYVGLIMKIASVLVAAWGFFILLKTQ